MLLGRACAPSARLGVMVRDANGKVQRDSINASCTPCEVVDIKNFPGRDACIVCPPGRSCSGEGLSEPRVQNWFIRSTESVTQLPYMSCRNMAEYYGKCYLHAM